MRTPRTHITYTVEAGGAVVEKELPFVVGVLGDFSGKPTQPLEPLRDRKFIPIDRDNFDGVLARMTPGLEFRVENTLAGDGSAMAVKLQFNCMEDFEPGRVVGQVEPLRKLLETRDKLRGLLTGVHHSGRIEGLLEQIIGGPGEESGGLGLPDPSPPVPTRAEVARRLGRAVSRIDDLMAGQVNAILHHPDFRKLEGTWRGLYYLVMNSETGATLKLKVLNVTEEDLLKDAREALGLDQTQIFQKVYKTEFDSPGGEPYGLLIGDYAFENRSEDVDILSAMSRVAAAAHCPFVAAAGPDLCGVSGFAGLEAPPDLDRTWADPAYGRWQAFRQSAGARFVALTLPRVLARMPYGSDTKPNEEFAFEELEGAVGPPPRDRLCWMSSTYVLAARVTDSWAKHGWPVRIVGLNTGGLVEGLPTLTWPGSAGDPRRVPTEWLIHPGGAMTLGRHGLVALAADGSADFAVFPSAPSVSAAAGPADAGPDHDRLPAGTLPFLLATGRVMHYLLVMLRDRAAAGMGPAEAEEDLNRWIKNYVDADEEAGREIRAKYPLREARVEIQEVPGAPGSYNVVAWLRPWLPGEDHTPVLPHQVGFRPAVP